ncbi:MAG: hypothetical protein IPO62_10605 [Saprospiraceae bacterium]|nr:hypothetical protein [Saprospiraceae bacterium]
MFKQIFFLFLISILWTSKTNAQFEIKAQPIAFLFEAFPISLEYGFREDWGVEADFIATIDYMQLAPGVKYYFKNTARGFDRWYCSAFAVGASFDGDNEIGIGFGGGYKYVSHKNIIFEIGLGIARGFIQDESFIPTGKLHLGYRFKGKEKVVQ